MNRFAKIIRMVKEYAAEVSGIGGVTVNRFISPKGLYSKPKGENAIVLALADGVNQDVIIALQKDVKLDNGDVILTDDKSFIHLQYDGNSIRLKTSSLLFDIDSLVVNAKSIDFNGCTIMNDGVPIDKTHVHPQNAGDHFGGGVDTSTPK